MAKAHIEAYKLYRQSAVTVGIDIYNIEAEALGCQLQFYTDNSIPGIISHPMTLDSAPGKITFSQNLGRIQLILDAATMVKEAIGKEAPVSIGICGPFSVLIELLGYETAIHAFIDEDDRITPLLEAVLQFQMDYTSAITAKGLGITVFESWASPPLITPNIYEEYALPYQQALFKHIDSQGLAIKPLVIGGDTRSILDMITTSGTTLLVSDYNTPLDMYVNKAKENGLTLRANIDPKLVRSGAFDEIETRIRAIYAQQEIHPKLIIGTGVVPYDTPPENLLRVRDIILEVHNQNP